MASVGRSLAWEPGGRPQPVLVSQSDSPGPGHPACHRPGRFPKGLLRPGPQSKGGASGRQGPASGPPLHALCPASLDVFLRSPETLPPLVTAPA